MVEEINNIMKNIKTYKEYNESFFGLFKKEDDDIADRMIKFIKKEKNLEIIQDRTIEVLLSSYETIIEIEKEKIELKVVKVKHFGGLGGSPDTYELCVDSVKLKCSESKMRKIYNLLERRKKLKEKEKENLENTEHKKKTDDLRWLTR